MWIIDKLQNQKKLDISQINNLRLLKYTPLVPSNDKDNIFIDELWFNKQSKKFQQILLQNFKNIELIQNVYHCDKKQFEDPESNYWKFLELYKQQFLFDEYAHIFDDVIIVELSNDDLNGLLGLCILFQRDTKVNIKEHHLQYLPNSLIDRINANLKKYDLEGFGVFVKTSIKSGKHYQKCFPCYTVLDVLSNLVFSKEVMQSLLNEKCNLIFKSFDPKIKENNEFRVYVLDKQIKCISQSKLNQIVDLEEYSAEEIIKFIEVLWNDLKTKVDYNDCVLDVYINNKKASIIEINSGGAWSTAGSALFSWDEIMKLSDPILRIVCNIHT